jgi:hypothetical protein
MVLMKCLLPRYHKEVEEQAVVVQEQGLARFSEVLIRVASSGSAPRSAHAECRRRDEQRGER